MYDQFYYIILLGQMLCTGCILEDSKLNMLVEIIFEELIRLNIMNIIYPLNKPDLKKNYINEFNKKYTFINYHLHVLITFIKLNKVMNKMIKKIGSFNKFIKMLDSNYGLLDDEIVNWLKKILKDEIIIEREESNDNSNLDINSVDEKDKDEKDDNVDKEDKDNKSTDYLNILYKLRGMNISNHLIKKYIDYGFKYKKNKKIINLIENNK